MGPIYIYLHTYINVLIKCSLSSPPRIYRPWGLGLVLGIMFLIAMDIDHLA